MEAPVSVSLGIARSLPAKLEQLLSPEADPGMRLPNGEKKKIRLVKERLQEVMDKFLMEPSDVEAPASTARCWVKEVCELAYDIDDFLDELTHGLHLAAARKNLRGRVAWLREGLSRSRWISHETAWFRARLEEAIQRHKRYSLGNLQIREIMIDSDAPPIPPLYGTEAKRLVGIDSSMEKLGEWLTGDGERQLRVVSIVGLGGVGKTTLAKELYCKLGNRFECRAFVRSSKKPDMRKFLFSILLQVRRQRLPNDTELGDLTGTIRAHLQDKKYFIILDDLWAPSMWDIVRRALPDDTCCSRVLATTEIDVVAHICSGHNSKHIFKMEPLSDDESKKLFLSRFPVNQSINNEQLFEVSSEIVRKCGGFPLATITTARLLARQQNSVEQCNCIRRSLRSNLRTDPTFEGMKYVLSLCYNNLPGHLKACMLYVSVYKEDQIIWKDDLVKQWIAQGFICAQEGKGKEEVANTYFDELVNEGMIQPVDTNCIGEVLSCAVHYMILNVIRYKSIEENFVTAIDHSQVNIRLADKVRRLSLQFGDAEDASQPTKLRLLQVQSLVFFGLLKSLPSIAEFRLFRVLILHLWGDQDNKSFDLTAICQLFRLRYLEIVCNVAMDLQIKMQDLQHLETLRIDSRISEIPPDIVHLPSLLHLSLPSDTNLPDGIGQLTSLQALGCFDLRSNSAENVIDLGELTNLQDLRLTCSTTPSDNLEEKLQCLGSILSKLNNLKSLTMSPAGSCNATLEVSTSSNAISCDGLSSLSSPPVLLQKLELFPQICIFSTLPKWIGKLRLLGILKIQVMGLSSDDVDILEGLPALSALLLYVQTAPAERILFYKEGFPVLKYFKFICSALCIAFMEGAMANVRRLKLGFDANTVVQYSPVDAGFEHLTGLGEISAKIGNTAADESSRVAAQSALESAFSTHRVNIKLVDWPFYGEKERTPAAQKGKHGTLEHCNPVPDVSTNEGSDKQYGIGVYGSKQDANKRYDNRITVSLESLDNDPEIQELGSGEATRRQGDTGDLSNNNLPGEAGSFSLSTNIRFVNDPYLCGSSATKPTSPGASPFPPSHPYNPTASVQSPGRCSSCIGAVADAVAAGAALLFAIPAICFAWCRQQTTEDHKLLMAVELGQLKRFLLKELQVATDDFSNKNILGRGRFGKVYKGRLPNGTLVAVKRMKEERTPRLELEFQAEVEVTAMAVHRNLLRLFGFCITQTEWVLVYPYMANGSVASRLRERQPSEPPLDWKTRTRIALGSSRGLSYLHDQCVQRIIHRDVKASNILLDENFEAVVGGLGLAKPMDHIVTDITTAVCGTWGYIAPEYLSTGRCSEKTDVYSYGIMLLELISGRRAFDLADLARLANDEDVILLDWVKELLKKKKLVELIDTDIQQNCIHAEVESLTQIALLCTQPSPMDRPRMCEVERMLEGKETWREIEGAAEASSSIKYSTKSTWASTDSTDNRHAVEVSELK